MTSTRRIIRHPKGNRARLVAERTGRNSNGRAACIAYSERETLWRSCASSALAASVGNGHRQHHEKDSDSGQRLGTSQRKRPLTSIHLTSGR